MIFKIGNRIIEKGNGIISLTSWPLIKKLLPKDFFHFTKEIKIDSTGNRIIRTGNGIIFSNSRPLIKIITLINVSYFHQGAQNWFKTVYGIIQPRNGINCQSFLDGLHNWKAFRYWKFLKLPHCVFIHVYQFIIFFVY